MPKPTDPTPIYIIVEGRDKSTAQAVAQSKGQTLAQWLRELIKYGIKRDRKPKTEGKP